jgi:hypothetical protein
MNWLKFVAVAAMLAAVAAPARAAQSVTGRWAADASACGLFAATAEQSPLVVTHSALRWHNDACRIARMYKTGDTVHIQALCWSFAGEDLIAAGHAMREHSIAVSLRPHGGLLAVTWDRGWRGDFRRCQ